ncbi:NAD(P)H-dependent oxidoreductase [Enterovibrio nigricans]|uniref:Putative NADPH-quinone reductase (Modulator of drug activity B) n=1 Tax=Enterovibrio nigricans DSM 22720 TaxID=1121868 RepID=A0A1T4VSF5_9GAMM|nr:NAD(P)H-dependent oxidoreductase [Enterovibrio nigricans]PKF49145.1 potassium transporter KefG [Enterovibrio nigricans]SKA67451.1 Putative NADPH-quinone reductase (modulator of drug activity B) [Enterovibrio nigricans DSM 22720]
MANESKKVLVLFAHPSQRRSEVNAPLFHVAKQVEGVTVVDLYAEYPTYHIDIDREQKRLVDHDVIIFQFPLYWYSTPSILKEWQDLVLEYGFAYGSKGNALHGKQFICAITAGGKEKAYKADGFNHFKIRELLHPLEQMANLTGMHYLAPFALFGSRTAVEEGKVERHAESYKRLLNAFVADAVDTDLLAKREKITSANVHLVLKEGAV